MLHNHLRHCATEAISSGDPEKTEAMYDELMELMYKNAR
jgi:DNA-binding FrmR family transcriptional regulator